MHVRLVTLAVIATGTACGNSPTYGGGGGGGGGHSTTITVNNNFFSPTPDTVSVGQVTFSWATPSNGHTLTWDSGPGTLPVNTAVITSGTQVVTLQAGDYHYHCSVHAGMNGTIHVNP